jgi:hypothetical protein
MCVRIVKEKDAYFVLKNVAKEDVLIASTSE